MVETRFYLPGHFGLIFDGRVETCFYYEVFYGPLDSYVTEGVTEGQRRPVVIATGADRRRTRGRDWSVATSSF